MSYTGLLAPSPAQFILSGDIIPHPPNWTISAPYSLTNKGMCLQFHLSRYGKADEALFLAALDCQARNAPVVRHAIFLKCLSSKGNQFIRAYPHRLRLLNPGDAPKGKLRTVYVRQNVRIPEPQEMANLCGFQIGRSFPRSYLSEVYPPNQWDVFNLILQPSHRCKIGAISFKWETVRFMLVLGVHSWELPLRGWVKIVRLLDNQKVKEAYDLCEPPKKKMDTARWDTPSIVLTARIVQIAVHGRTMFYVKVCLFCSYNARMTM